VHTQQALSTAELLLEQGKRVEVISPLFYVGQDIGVTSIAPLYKRLFTRGVVLTPGTELAAARPTASIAPSRARCRSSTRSATASRRAASTRPSSTPLALLARFDGCLFEMRLLTRLCLDA